MLCGCLFARRHGARHAAGGAGAARLAGRPARVRHVLHLGLVRHELSRQHVCLRPPCVCAPPSSCRCSPPRAPHTRRTPRRLCSHARTHIHHARAPHTLILPDAHARTLAPARARTHAHPAVARWMQPTHAVFPAVAADCSDLRVAATARASGMPRSSPATRSSTAPRGDALLLSADARGHMAPTRRRSSVSMWTPAAAALLACVECGLLAAHRCVVCPPCASLASAHSQRSRVALFRYPGSLTRPIEMHCGAPWSSMAQRRYPGTGSVNPGTETERFSIVCNVPTTRRQAARGAQGHPGDGGRLLGFDRRVCHGAGAQHARSILLGPRNLPTLRMQPHSLIIENSAGIYCCHSVRRYGACVHSKFADAQLAVTA